MDGSTIEGYDTVDYLLDFFIGTTTCFVYAGAPIRVSHLFLTGDLIRANNPVANAVDRVVMRRVGCSFLAGSKGAFPFVDTPRDLQLLWKGVVGGSWV